MPKVKWEAAAADDALTASDVDSAESGFTPYSGDLPPAGVYRFKLKRVKVETFGTGNMGLKVLMELDGSWKDAHRKYDGAPVWANVVFTKGAAAFVKAFGSAIGVTSAALLSNVVTDEKDLVTKIGTKKITEDTVVYANIKKGRQDAESDWKSELNGTGFLPAPVASDAADEDEGSADPFEDEAETEAPKKSKKAKGAKTPEPAPVKASKKSKAKAAADEEPPF